MMGEKRNIAMVLDNAFVSDLRVEKEALSLIGDGFQVTIFCHQDPNLPQRETLKNGIQLERILDDFLFYPLRSSYKSNMQRAAKRILAHHPDFVHCHDFFTLEIGAIMKGLNPSIFLAYDAHEYFKKWAFYQDLPDPLNRFKGYLSWRFLIWRERANSKKADLVISTTSAICDKMKSNYGLNKQIMALRNITSLTPSGVAGQDIRSQLGLKDGHILVQSGNIYQTYDQLRSMFDAVLKIDNLVFVLIGNRPRFYEVKNWVEKHDAYRFKILFLDYNAASLYDQLSSADFGVLYMKTDVWESHRLTSPNRIMEYSLCGLPFLSVDQFSSHELNNKYGHVIFYDLNKADDFGLSLTKMMAELNERKARATCIKDDLSWEKEFAPVLAIYKRAGRVDSSQ